ncbi:MAG: hypothetical protein CVU38_19545 [Chloroflexi bacterium HGW-Chloroflexi-1]|nr:MAG: hypothetical protein CVU38_19545 [Chloroflexi bacterium HGW-Chloroflexi-1]
MSAAQFPAAPASQPTITAIARPIQVSSPVSIIISLPPATDPAAANAVYARTPDSASIASEPASQCMMGAERFWCIMSLDHDPPDSRRTEAQMLHVENLTRGAILVDHGRVADNFWTRMKGLIGVRGLAEGDGLLITPCNGVISMFMSIPIDVLYVSPDDRVVAMDPAMKPWAVGRIYRGVRYVIELPASAIARTGTAVGDALRVTCYT